MSKVLHLLDIAETKATANFVPQKIEDRNPDQYLTLLQNIGDAEEAAEKSQTEMEA